MIIPKEKAAESLVSGQSNFQYRRMPAVPRKIADINPETDIRVRLLGKIIDRYEGTVVIDDGSGKAEVVAEENAGGVGSDFVRVFCRVLPLETGYELRAEIIQDMSSLDINLNKKIHG